MAAKKKATVAPVVSVTVDGETLEFKTPSTEIWDRFLEKLRRDQELVGRREIVYSCCTSHQPDENGKIKALDKRPALIKKISFALDSVCGGDVVVEVDGDTVTACEGEDSCSFNGPNMDQWELMQEHISDPKMRYGETLRSFLYDLSEDRAVAEAFISRRPGCMGPIVHAIGKLAGSDISVEVKKG